MKTAFEASAVHKYQGKAGQAHRVIIFSADLCSDGEEKPWSTPTKWSETAQQMVEYMVTHTGPADVLLACDGRSRQRRLSLEKALVDARHVSELWLVYAPSARLGRKVSFASDNKEVLLLSTPVNRTQLATKARDTFNSVGEASTHDSTYTGVAPLPWGAMNRLLREDKEKIIGFRPPTTPEKLFDATTGMPLFWQERKSPKLWRQILEDLDAKSVFDLTPGSGSCARACLDAGIEYVGLALNAPHSAWLQGLLDRYALRTFMSPGTPLFNTDTSTDIKEHFGEYLEALTQMDAQLDSEPSDEVES